MRRALIALATLVVLIVGIVAATYAVYSSRLSPSHADREAVEAVLDAEPGSNDVEGSVESTDTAVYVLLLGNDRRTGESWARSDTIIIARLDDVTGSVSMVSIPRDTRVYIEGHGFTKIGHSSAYGGPALAVATVKEFTGLPIHHYVEIDFEGFVGVVDAVGGVEIDVDRAVTSGGEVVVSPGLQVLDGEKALLYVRNRKAYASGDFARMSNQQAFLLALAQEISKSSNFDRLPSILNSLSKHLETDMNIPEILEFAGQYRSIDASTLRTASMPGTTSTIDGVSYVIADEEAAAALFADMADGGLEKDD